MSDCAAHHRSQKVTLLFQHFTAVLVSFKHNPVRIIEQAKECKCQIISQPCQRLTLKVREFRIREIDQQLTRNLILSFEAATSQFILKVDKMRTFKEFVLECKNAYLNKWYQYHCLKLNWLEQRISYRPIKMRAPILYLANRWMDSKMQ